MEQNFPVRASNALPAPELQLCQSLDLALALISALLESLVLYLNGHF